MAHKSYIADTVRALKDLGCKVEIEQGRHAKVFVSANGRNFIWVAALTPSDWRSEKNDMAHLRRELRACGIEPPRRALRGVGVDASQFAPVWALIIEALTLEEPDIETTPGK